MRPMAELSSSAARPGKDTDREETNGCLLLLQRRISPWPVLTPSSWPAPQSICYLSPRIGYASCLPDTAPVRAEVILRLGQLAIAGYRGRHVGLEARGSWLVFFLPFSLRALCWYTAGEKGRERTSV